MTPAAAAGPGPADPDDTHIGMPAIRPDAEPAYPGPPAPFRLPTHVVVTRRPIGFAAAASAIVRRNGEVRPSDAVGLDSLTPVLLVAWVIATGAVLAYQLSQVPGDVPPVAVGLARSLLWSTYLAKAFTFAAVVAPLCWLAVFVAGKLQRFELPSGGYLRAAGVAALPEIAVLCVRQFTPDNPALRVMLLLGILPLAFLALKHAYDLRPAEAVVAYGFGLAFFAVGWAVSSALIGAVVSSALAQSQGQVDAAVAAGEGSPQQGSPPSAGRTTPAGPTAGGGQTPVPPPPPLPPLANVAETVVAPLRGRAEALAGQVAAAEQSGPEQATAAWQALARDVAAAKAAQPNLPEWAALDQAVAATGAKLAALPPAAPPASAFEPMPADRPFPPLSPGGAGVGLADEVAFGGFRFRPPADARVDLEAAAVDLNTPVNPNVLTYVSDKAQARLTLTLVPRANPRQQRPVVVTRAYQRPAAEAQNLLVAADVADAGPAAAADVSFGTLFGQPFARVAARTSAGGDPARDGTSFVTLADADRWLVVRAYAGPQRDEAAALAFETSARTLRPARAGEPASDPYAPSRVASQFATDPTRVGELFRRSPAEAEPFVVSFLSDKDPAVRNSAAKLLPAVATARSAGRLLPLAASTADPQLSAVVRQVLRKVAPDRFDVVAEALLDLRAEDPNARERALDALAAPGVTVPADRARRDDVAGELEALVLDAQSPPSAADKAARLLGDWGTGQTAARLAAALGGPNVTPALRDRLIAALAGTRSPAAAAAVVRWVAQATEPTVAALVRMGPAAEDEVVRVLNGTLATRPPRAGGPAGAGGGGLVGDPPDGGGLPVRQACVKVLAEIGTAKCLDALGRCVRDRNDPAGRAAAKDAMEQVRARVAAAKAAGATRPG